MPLTFDLSLEDLASYSGTNPRPSNFDEYWNQALIEMQSVDPQVELVPADFKVPFADCFHLYFTGVGGARIHARYLRPKNLLAPGPAVLVFHGYAGCSGDWFDKLGYPAMGFNLLAMDCRGQGASEDPGISTNWSLGGHIVRGLDGTAEALVYRQIFLDAVELAQIAMLLPGVAPNRVGVFGGSQGGGLTLACAALEPRIRRLAPIHPFLCDYQRVWQMDLAKDAYGELKEYFRKFDPLHHREVEIFTRLGYIDVQHLCPRIRGEVMMITGLMDTITPPSTQFAAYNKIRSPKSMRIYPDFGHEIIPGVYDEVMQFMQKL